jgi:hypothetical protein
MIRKQNYYIILSLTYYVKEMIVCKIYFKFDNVREMIIWFEQH